ncbi:Glycine cleavage system H protein, mitochondrial [Gracilariopsis chorda]|uniref:Glycine cleavage system H protein n=1 Tax=Gracilariopsis chorda TaxID=448386 RepID=A0A2V3J2M3_9FLOR|nr:Glycine cleavage system H protein, mitochondrial [Gracilariopsis chorda]|eukprot:PXF48247.1 Glycine cleavage system H protein, mitochondrial [Gracilariopsis chorda]
MATLLRSLPLRRVAQSAPAFMRPSLLRHFSSYPSDRKYNSSHEWAKLDGDVATIGITDHAQAALGDIVFADLPEVGSSAVSGERAATVESVKAAADIYAPLDGEVVGVNEKLEETPDLINSEPHEEGWIFQIKVSDPSQLDALMGSDDYEKTLEEK